MQHKPTDEWKSVEVKPADKVDVYRDIARINIETRGRHVNEGDVYRLSVRHGGRKTLVIVRGQNDSGTIKIDEITRNILKLSNGEHIEFKLARANYVEMLYWMSLKQSDASGRVSVSLGVISVALGILSLTPILFDFLHTIISTFGRNSPSVYHIDLNEIIEKTLATIRQGAKLLESRAHK